MAGIQCFMLVVCGDLIFTLDTTAWLCVNWLGGKLKSRFYALKFAFDWQ